MFGSRGMTDERAVRRVLGGEREAYGVLVERYFASAQAVGYAHTGNRTDADDVAQEAFLRAFRGLGNLREYARFGPWLLAIARNVANSLAARRRREAEIRAEIAPREASVTPDVDRRELCESVRQQVMRLNEAHREILLLHYFSGKSVREIAELTETTPNAAKKRLQRARKSLSVTILRELRRDDTAETRKKPQVERVIGLVAAMPADWETVPGMTAGGGATTAASVAVMKAGVAGLILLAGLVCGVLAFNSRRPPIVEASQTPPACAAEAVVEEPVPHPVASEPGVRAAVAPDGVPRPSLGSISGVVVDVEGRPLAEATVAAYNEEDAIEDAGGFEHGQWVRTSTGADGAFSLKDLGPGTYAVIVRPASESRHLESGQRRIRLASGQHMTGLRFVFGEGPSVWGYVTDGEGWPIAKAAVRADHMREPGFNIVATTQDDGFYLIQGLPQGDYAFTVTAAAPGYISAPFARDVMPGSERSFVLLPRPLVEGQVVRADTGEPVTRFGIFIGNTPVDRESEIESWGDAWHCQDEQGGAERFRPGFQYHEVQDKDGRFSEYAVGSGDVTVRVVAPGLAMAGECLAGLQPGQLVQDVVVRLEPGRAVEGIVVDGSGVPIEDAAVFVGHPPIWYSRGDIRPFSSTATAAETGPDGVFRIDAVIPDARWFSAFHPDYAPAMLEPAWPGNGEAHLEFVLTKGGTIAGRALLDGRPLREGGCSVTAILPSTRQGCVACGATDRTSHFRLTKVTPGIVTVRGFLAKEFLPEGIEHWVEAEVEVFDDRPTQLDIGFTSGHDAAIEGIVSSEAGPVGSVTLELWAERHDGCRACYWVGAGPDGAYRFDPIPAASLTGRVMGVTEGGAAFDQAFNVSALSGQVVQHDIVIVP